MKKIFYLLLLLVLYGCDNINQKDTVKIVQYDVLSENSSMNNLKNFLNTYPRAWYAGQINLFKQQPERQAVVVRNSKDSIAVFNSLKNSYVAFALPDSLPLPIKSIYFHNFDSLFLFFDFELIYHYRKNNECPDFILVDSSGRWLNSYSYPKTLNLYNGQKEGFIFPSSELIEGCRINGDFLYLPFSIYLENAISNPKMKEFNTKLLCKFNLKNGDAKMLPIKLPDEDVGKSYMTIVGNRSNSINFLLHDNSIFFSYFHSPNIYKYSLKDGSLKEIYMPNNFIQNSFGSDTINNNYYFVFRNISYSKKIDSYMRTVIMKFKDNPQKTIYIKELFNSDFSLLGYHFSDGLAVIGLGQKSYYIYNKGINKYFNIKIRKSIDVPSDSLMKVFIHNDNKKKTVTNNALSKLGLHQRLELYYSSLNIPDSTFVIQINSDMNCIECLEFLTSKIKENPNKNIYFIFVGSNVEVMLHLLENYEVKPGKRMVFDINNSFNKYFILKELKSNYLIRNKNGEIKSVDFNNFVESINQVYKESK